MRRTLPWVWTGAVAVATIYFTFAGWSDFEDNFSSTVEQVVFLVFPILYTALGTVVFIRQPGNRIAWLFYIVGLGGVFDAALSPVIDGKPDPVTTVDLLAMMWSHLGWFVALLIPLFLLLFLFPTGRFLTRRWSWGGWLAGTAWSTILVTIVFREEMNSAGLDENWVVDNPIGFLPGAPFEEEISGVLELSFGLSLIGLLAGGIIAILVRYRRSDLTVRTQIKWVMFSLTLFAVTIAVRLFWENWGSLLTDVVLVTSLALIPTFITIAIVRYRLFDIDRLVSRTIGYVLVSAVLGSLYLVGAVWLPTQLLGEQPPLFVAGTTLGIVALFSPVRRRILGWVDRRFYRSRYRADLVVDSFSTRIRDEVEVEKLTDDWARVVTDTLQPQALGIWVTQRD